MRSVIKKYFSGNEIDDFDRFNLKKEIDKAKEDMTDETKQFLDFEEKFYSISKSQPLPRKLISKEFRDSNLKKRSKWITNYENYLKNLNPNAKVNSNDFTMSQFI